MGLKSIAFHEAAHAVAQAVFNSTPHEVTIVPNPGKQTLGHADAVDGCEDFNYPDLIAEERIICLAGYAAELKLSPARAKKGIGGSSSDFEKADSLSEPGKTAKDYLKAARKFVDENWQAITLVARELLLHKTLSGQEVELLVHLARGEISLVEYCRFRLGALENPKSSLFKFNSKTHVMTPTMGKVTRPGRPAPAVAREGKHHGVKTRRSRMA